MSCGFGCGLGGKHIAGEPGALVLGVADEFVVFQHNVADFSLDGGPCALVFHRDVEVIADLLAGGGAVGADDGDDLLGSVVVFDVWVLGPVSDALGLVDPDTGAVVDH